MSKRQICRLAILTLLIAGSTRAAEPPKPDPAAMMKAWEKYAAPGAPHQQMAKLAGKWTTSNTMWMDESQPPMTQTGTAEYTLALGGRYVTQNYKSEMMGMPFEGIGTLGYDNFRQRYFSTWIDNMGTGLMTATGTANAAGNEITYTGTMDDPMTGEKDKKFREVVKIAGPDAFTFEMFETRQGKERRVMEIKHTRMP
jgi:hypothetical protein